MKEIFKAILKYLFANTQLDEKVADVLETAKTEVTKLDEKYFRLLFFHLLALFHLFALLIVCWAVD